MGKVIQKKDAPQDADSLPTLVTVTNLTDESLRLRPPPPNVIIPPPIGPNLKITTTEFQSTPTIKVN